MTREKDLEVRTVSEVAPVVRKHGVAILRKLVPDHITSAMLEPISNNLTRQDSYVSLRYGVLNLSILPQAMQEACIVPEISAVFASVMGRPYGQAAHEIYVTRPGFYAPHPWHQDANEANQEYHFMT